MNGSVLLAYDYPLLGAFWSLLWFFLWILWLLLLFRIIFDIFRDRGMGGLAKAAWLLFVIIIPFLGVLVYVIVRGRGMGEREIEHARAQQKQFDAYVRQTAAGASGADQLATLSELKAKGELSEQEFQQAKAKILS